MNLNNIYKPYEILTPNIPINTRAKLDTGTHCNYRCSFCYYLKDLDKKTDYQIIIDRAKKLKDNGITEVDLSGGESSIHKDWFKILKFCNNNFKNVSTLSNGSKFKNFNFLQQSKEYGLTEILFSLHGWDSISHDNKVKHNGAFNDLIKSIINASILDILIRINCTVQGDFNPDEYFKIIKQLHPSQINLLPLNFWEDAKTQQPINYNNISNNIKKFIDLMKNDILTKNIEINVRYIPFCYMEDYQEYVVGTYQHIFDLKDWNIETYHNNFSGIISKSGAFSQAFNNRKHTYIKPLECKNCKYIFICDGVEKELTPNVVPVIGEPIKNIMHFRN